MQTEQFCTRQRKPADMRIKHVRSDWLILFVSKVFFLLQELAVKVWTYVCLMNRFHYCASSAWDWTQTRDVTNSVFALDDLRILATFQLFDIRQIVGSISGKCKYLILFNLINLIN